MSEVAEKLKAAILELSLEERLEMLAALMDSLPAPPGAVSEDDPEFDTTLQRRIEEMDNSRVKGVPAEEVMERLRKKYAK